MARIVTRLTLQGRIYKRANLENHTALAPNADVQDDINEVLAEVWDEYVDASPPDRVSSETTITTSNGVTLYALPADFYALRAVWVDQGSGERRPIRSIGDQERQAYRAPPGAYSVILKYIQACPLLASDGATFDGIDGFEEMAVLAGAIRLLTKENADKALLGILLGERENQRRRIAAHAHANLGEPERVSRRANPYIYPYARWLSSAAVHAYQLQGANINLFQYAGATVL